MRAHGGSPWVGARVDRSATPIRYTDAAHGRLTTPTAGRLLVELSAVPLDLVLAVGFTKQRLKKKRNGSFARRLRYHFARLRAGLHSHRVPCAALFQ